MPLTGGGTGAATAGYCNSVVVAAAADQKTVTSTTVNCAMKSPADPTTWT